MKKIAVLAALALAACALAVSGCRPEVQVNRDTVFQVSTISALMKGAYDGQLTLADLRRYGDFGLGTFEALDGEMVELDGSFYQVKLDGSVVRPPDSLRTPFAAVTFFDSDLAVVPGGALGLAALQSFIDSSLPGKNLFYAVRVDGKFGYMKTRSVPAQSKPFVPLSEAVARGQQVSEASDIVGTLIGLRCPPYVEGVNVAGYHFHFLDRERSRGGHVLDCKTDAVRVVIDSTSNLTLVLPESAEFNRLDLGAGQPAGLQQVEQGK